MIRITIPHPSPDYDERHGGPTAWTETLSDAHYAWEAAGLDLRSLDGRKSGESSVYVRDVIQAILNDPNACIASAGYLNTRAIVANLTGLFFTLRQVPDGIVHVSDR
jgi:hypothetical protein